MRHVKNKKIKKHQLYLKEKECEEREAYKEEERGRT